MNDELIAKTPIGEIVVGIKSDHDYPGIFIELRGEHLNCEQCTIDETAVL